MMPLFPDSEHTMLIYALNSIVLIAALFLFRALIIRLISKDKKLTIETRRRWMITVRNAMPFLFIFGMVVIWAAPLRALVVSLFAIAVAIVLATKEVILCVGGSLYRMWTQAYTLGDRIEIGQVRGRVLDQDWLSTTVVEIGPSHTSHEYTGRTVTIPNSLLLNTPAINETRTDDYVLHIITVPLNTDDHWPSAEQALLQAANAECHAFLEEAKQHMKTLEEKEWLEAPAMDPQVTMRIPEPGRLNLLVSIPAPSHRVSQLEQAILRRFLSLYQPAAKRERSLA